jgi:hypothetical protein
MLVFLDGAAQAVVSADVEMGDAHRIGDWCSGCGSSFVEYGRRSLVLAILGFSIQVDWSIFSMVIGRSRIRFPVAW